MEVAWFVVKTHTIACKLYDICLSDDIVQKQKIQPKNRSQQDWGTTKNAKVIKRTLYSAMNRCRKKKNRKWKNKRNSILTWTCHMVARHINTFRWIIKRPFKFHVSRICIDATSYLSLLLFRHTVHTRLIWTARWCVWYFIRLCMEKLREMKKKNDERKN